MELSDRILKFELDGVSSLFVNSSTGAIDIVPVRLSEGMSDSEREYLGERGYFISEEERLEKLSYLKDVNQQHSKNVPYWFYVLTTLNCNFGCPICYEKDTLVNSEMDSETLGKVIESISRFQEEHEIPNDRMNLVIFGGNPLSVSNPDIIRQILEYSSENGWKDVIVTNGSRVKKFIGLFKEYSEAVSDFRITLDGPREVHNLRRPFRSGRGSFEEVVGAIDLLLENDFLVKMQTILGSGNTSSFDDLIGFVKRKDWLQHSQFQWRIEASHDYANLDPEKDEISEGKMVKRIIQSWEDHKELHGKMKFESFKYLGHIVRSFGWLGEYKTYWGPKFGFCEPQKGFHYVFSTDGQIYHCPRTINNPEFKIGEVGRDFYLREEELKQRSILERKNCLPCKINTLCGGGCVVQKKYYENFDCEEYALSIISEFIDLMKDKILERADPDKIVSVNDLW